MPRARKIILSVAGLMLVLVIAAFALFYRTIRQEQARIRSRYQQMRTALSAGDTNTVLTLIAPQMRSSFDDLRLSRLDGFAQPLGPRSSVLILGGEATVWPVRTSHYVVLPGGHTVEMIKVDGDWFFTGKIHVD